jgi:uncharacterized protein
MMRVPCQVKPSEIHGTGVFATEKLEAGRVVWAYEPGIDRGISDFAVRNSEPRVADYIRERGYINPARPMLWIICVDESQFLNFPRKSEVANLSLGGSQDGESLLLAAREIQPGEELTVPPESDADYERKMGAR